MVVDRRGTRRSTANSMSISSKFVVFPAPSGVLLRKIVLALAVISVMDDASFTMSGPWWSSQMSGLRGSGEPAFGRGRLTVAAYGMFECEGACEACVRRYGCMTPAWGRCCTHFYQHNGRKRVISLNGEGSDDEFAYSPASVSPETHGSSPYSRLGVSSSSDRDNLRAGLTIGRVDRERTRIRPAIRSPPQIRRRRQMTTARRRLNMHMFGRDETMRRPVETF